jgi:hypothetical protein
MPTLIEHFGFWPLVAPRLTRRAEAPNQSLQLTAGRRDDQLEFHETVVEVMKARSRQRWLPLFSLRRKGSESNGGSGR